jgi:hypothetical protein
MRQMLCFRLSDESRSAGFVEPAESVRCLGFAYLCLMNTGFPLHFTVKVVPSAIAPTSNSADARARTSADGLMLETNLKRRVKMKSELHS